MKLLIVLIALLFSSNALAGTVTGSLRYIKNWPGCRNGQPNSAMDCSKNGQNLPLKNIYVEFRRTSDNVLIGDAKASASGVYSRSLPAGNYRMHLSYRDGTVGNGTSDLGTAGVALVSDINAGLANVLTNQVVSNIVVTSSGTAVVNYTVDSNSPTQVRERANAYAGAMAQQDVWEIIYGGSWFNNQPGSMYRVRIQPVTSNASGGARCPQSNFDCVMGVRASFTTGFDILWHETGHGMQQMLQIVLLGQTWSNGLSGCANQTLGTAANSLIEGWADFVATLTEYRPGTVPGNVYGNICGSCQYSPNNPQPNPSACGTDAINRRRSAVARALVDLVDTTAADSGCVPETLALSPATLLDALAFFNGNGCVSSNGTCSGICGFSEGGVVESLCGNVNASWPYTGSNALPNSDQTSLLDFLGILKTNFGVSGTQLRNIWASSCWQPGDSSVTLP